MARSAAARLLDALAGLVGGRLQLEGALARAGPAADVAGAEDVAVGCDRRDAVAARDQREGVRDARHEGDPLQELLDRGGDLGGGVDDVAAQNGAGVEGRQVDGSIRRAVSATSMAAWPASSLRRRSRAEAACAESRPRGPRRPTPGRGDGVLVPAGDGEQRRDGSDDPVLGALVVRPRAGRRRRRGAAGMQLEGLQPCLGRGAVPVGVALGSQAGSRSRPRVGELGLSHLVGRRARPRLPSSATVDSRAANSFSASAARASEAATMPSRRPISASRALDAGTASPGPARPAWPDLRGGRPRRGRGGQPGLLRGIRLLGVLAEADGRLELVERRGDPARRAASFSRAWAAWARSSLGVAAGRRLVGVVLAEQAHPLPRDPARGVEAVAQRLEAAQRSCAWASSGRPQRTRPREGLSRDRRSVRVCSKVERRAMRAVSSATSCSSVEVSWTRSSASRRRRASRARPG